MISTPNIEVRRHEILKDELEKSEYDLAHCCKLLHHLPGAEKAVRRMADSLRPGGWLLIEEDDYGSALSLDVTDQSVAPYMAAQRASYDSLRKKGIADYYFGHRVRGLVEQLGFDDLGHEGWGGLQRIGAPNVEIRRHDILKDELEEREFDLVHCRKVLHHLARAEDH